MDVHSALAPMRKTLPLVNGLRSRSTTAENPVSSLGFLGLPVLLQWRMLQSIAKQSQLPQLTLCQVTTDEVIPPPTARHGQKLRGDLR